MSPNIETVIVKIPYTGEKSLDEVVKLAQQMYGPSAEVVEHREATLSPDHFIARVSVRAAIVDGTEEPLHTYVYDVAVRTHYKVTIMAPSVDEADKESQEIDPEMGVEEFTDDDWDLRESSDPSTGAAYETWKRKSESKG